MSRAREAEQQLAAKYYAFAGFPESMLVFFFFGSSFALGVSHFRSPPGLGYPPGKVKRSDETDVRKTPA